MRELLAKRIKARRKKDQELFGNYLIDYADVSAAIAILITFRIILLLTLVYLCPIDYLIFWFGYHEEQVPAYWGFVTVYGLAAIWLVAKMIKDAQVTTKARWINHTVRSSLVVFLFFHAMFVPSMIIGYNIGEDVPDKYYHYQGMLRLSTTEIIIYDDPTIPNDNQDWHKSIIAYENFERRCPRYFEDVPQGFDWNDWEKWYPKKDAGN